MERSRIVSAVLASGGLVLEPKGARNSWWRQPMGMRGVR